MKNFEFSELVLDSPNLQLNNYKEFPAKKGRNTFETGLKHPLSGVISPTTFQAMSFRPTTANSQKNINFYLTSPTLKSSQHIPTIEEGERVFLRNIETSNNFFRTQPAIELSNFKMRDVQYIPTNQLIRNPPVLVHNAFPKKQRDQKIITMRRSEKMKVIRRQREASESMSRPQTAQKISTAVPVHVQNSLPQTYLENKLIKQTSPMTKKIIKIRPKILTLNDLSSDKQMTQNYKSFKPSENRGSRPNSAATTNLYKGLSQQLTPGRTMQSTSDDPHMKAIHHLVDASGETTKLLNSSNYSERGQANNLRPSTANRVHTARAVIGGTYNSQVRPTTAMRSHQRSPFKSDPPILFQQSLPSIKLLLNRSKNPQLNFEFHEHESFQSVSKRIQSARNFDRQHEHMDERGIQMSSRVHEGDNKSGNIVVTNDFISRMHADARREYTDLSNSFRDQIDTIECSQQMKANVNYSGGINIEKLNVMENFKMYPKSYEEVLDMYNEEKGSKP